jgi:hypothetical protein
MPKAKEVYAALRAYARGKTIGWDAFKAKVAEARKECAKRREDKRAKKAKAWRDWMVEQHEVGSSAVFQHGP